MQSGTEFIGADFAGSYGEIKDLKQLVEKLKSELHNLKSHAFQLQADNMRLQNKVEEADKSKRIKSSHIKNFNKKNVLRYSALQIEGNPFWTPSEQP